MEPGRGPSHEPDGLQSDRLDVKQPLRRSGTSSTASSSWGGERGVVVVHDCPDSIGVGCDQGIGLVRTGEPEVPLALSEAAVDALTYLDLDTNRGALLNLRPAEHLAEFLA